MDVKMADTPHLLVRCSCGNGMAFELGHGKRIPYTGLKSARVLANVFRHFHAPHGEVTEEIKTRAEFAAEGVHLQNMTA